MNRGEQVVDHIHSAYNKYRMEHRGDKPLFLYISFDEYMDAKRTPFVQDHFIGPDGTIRIFGMEVIIVNKENFIRVGN